MKLVLTILIVSFMLGSCYKPYYAEIEARDTILVVDGLITNEPGPYQVKIYTASPFDSTLDNNQVSGALVSVTDDKGEEFIFDELSTGAYFSDSQEFRGEPGRTYILNIRTPDGKIYTSNPQTMHEAYTLDSVYAELEYVTTISRFNQEITTLRGAGILTDIKSESDTLPNFRFKANLMKQYFYALELPPPVIDPPLYSFYCWVTDDINEVNISGKSYVMNSRDVTRHSLCFVDDAIKFEAPDYRPGDQNPDLSYEAIQLTSRQIYTIKHRILNLDRYVLNNESYQYYRKIRDQLSAEGKMFDPIASQIVGNIKCPTDPGKKVFGFFEASSVSHASYVIGYSISEKYTVRKIPYNPPFSANGCWINKVPPFWI
jgi:hypothetical protein